MKDFFGFTIAAIAVATTLALWDVVLQRDEARDRTRVVCNDVVAGLERELLRHDVDASEANLVLGAAWQPLRNCILDLPVDAHLLDDLYSGEVHRRRLGLRLVREWLER